MTPRDFSLQSFPAVGPQPELHITGSVLRRSRIFAIHYALPAPLTDLVIPAPAAVPVRSHGLWQETCFEFFLAVKNAPGYWEFNLTPAGHWNVYRFTDYREGMREESAFATLPLRVDTQPDRLTLTLECPLEQLFAPHEPLEVAISAVIRHANGQATYWALTHPGPQPDFHCRESFIVEL
jgi:hypothetical protein